MRGKIFRWALGSGLTGAILAGLYFWLMFAFATGRVTDPLGWVVIFLPLAGLLLALKWPLAGGLLLVLEGLAMTGWIVFTFIQLNYAGLGGTTGIRFQVFLLLPLAIGLLLLASGVLFIIHWRRGRRGRG